MNRRLFGVMISPLLAVSLLVAAEVESLWHTTPADAEAYHARVREHADAASLPTTIRGSGEYNGTWIAGRDKPVVTAAQRLLKPNVIVVRRYDYHPVGVSSNRSQVDRVDLLLVACKDTRDMLGHYPPVCYAGVGQDQEHAERRVWQVRDLTLPGYEYHFAKYANTIEQRSEVKYVIYNFMIAQGESVVANMDELTPTMKNYERRRFGAAQIQLRFSGPVRAQPQEVRDQILKDFLENPKMYRALQALLSGGEANE